MRLTCPNCDAQYEVADDVIPEAGRDVQCSNCGHTWFQYAAGYVPDEDVSEAFEPTPEVSDAADGDADEDAADDIPGENFFDAGTETGETRADPEADPEPEPQPTPRPQRQTLDPEVTDILREEAEYEAQARAAQGIESQPDLGLEAAAPREDDLARRMAQLRGEPDPAVHEAPATRRELLPDIEEINSTLRSDTARTTPDTAVTPEIVEAKRRSGFRMGFGLVMIFAAIAVGLYVYAGEVIAAVPASEPAMTAYVDGVNDLRIWLDERMTGLLSQMNTEES